VAEHRAVVVWEGGLTDGSGNVELATRVTGALPVTWSARTGVIERMTSPEELIAGAHAACFSMSLSGALARAGHPPRRLEVSATCTFDKTEQGFRITGMNLELRGDVPGMDAAGFQEQAEVAKENCPVSKALEGNVPISLKASFA
jgi:osmotically inducible protein OsmC